MFQREKCLAEGREWVDPEVEAEREQARFEAEAEETALRELEETCKRKGWDYEQKRSEYQQRRAEEQEKKEQKRNAAEKRWLKRQRKLMQNGRKKKPVCPKRNAPGGRQSRSGMIVPGLRSSAGAAPTARRFSAN